MLLPTTLVGSYPQPDWLIDRTNLGSRLPPRVRVAELWCVAPEWLEQAQDDATLIAIRDQERAGVDVVSTRSCGGVITHTGDFSLSRRARLPKPVSHEECFLRCPQNLLRAFVGNFYRGGFSSLGRESSARKL